MHGSICPRARATKRGAGAKDVKNGKILWATLHGYHLDGGQMAKDVTGAIGQWNGKIALGPHIDKSPFLRKQRLDVFWIKAHLAF